jgi:hypothetical protein
MDPFGTLQYTPLIKSSIPLSARFEGKNWVKRMKCKEYFKNMYYILLFRSLNKKE